MGLYSWLVRKLKAALRLDSTEKRLTAQALRHVLRARRWLHYRGFRATLLEVNRRASRRGQNSPMPGVDPHIVCRAIVRAADHLSDTYNCLPRALAGYVLLMQYGYQPELRIGVVPGVEVEAHAWLELDGEVVLGALPEISRFVPFEGVEDLVR